MIEIELEEFKPKKCRCESDVVNCECEKILLSNSKIKAEGNYIAMTNKFNSGPSYEYQITETFLDECISEFLLNTENLKLLFAIEDNEIDYNDYIRAFIDTSLVGKNDKEIEEVVSSKNSTFYSFIAEGLQLILLSKFYSTKFILLGYFDKRTLNLGQTGADCCLYSEEKDLIILGEAKFYSSFTGGVNAIKNSMIKSENKLATFFNAVNTNSLIFGDLRDATGLITSEKILENNTTISGFILHYGNQKHTDIHEIKSENYLSPSEMKREIKNYFPNYDENKQKLEHTTYIHLMCTSKVSLIQKVVSCAYKRLENKQ